MNPGKPPPLREQPPPKARRVYESVSVGEGPDGRVAVLLDGKPALTPLRAPLAVSSRALAKALAAEWDAQRPGVDPERMPLTRLVATALDRIAPQREAVIASLLTYVHADTLCFRASHPSDLRRRQARVWQPVIDWLRTEQGIMLIAAEGVMPTTQPADTVARMRRALEAMNDTELTGFQAAAALAGSLALAFALVRRRLSAAEVFAAAFLDELFQAELWGEDSLARERRERLAADLGAVGRYLDLATP